MNTVIIDKFLIHKFDMEHSKVITSDKLIDLDSGSIEYYDIKIDKAIHSPIKKEVIVGSEHQVFQYATKMLESEEAFKENAKAISNDLFNLCKIIPEMPDANIFYVECKIDGQKHILVLKINYKAIATCLMDESDGLNNIRFVNRQMPPAKTSAIDDALIINVDKRSLSIIEKRYLIDGKFGYLINDHYIKGEPKLSDKQKIGFINKIVKQVDSVYNVVEGNPLPFVKKEVANLILEKQPIKPVAVAKKVLEKDYNAVNEAQDLFEEVGIIEQDEVINVPGNLDKMSRCKLVIDEDRVVELDLDDYLNKRNLSIEHDALGNTILKFTNIRDIVVK